MSTQTESAYPGASDDDAVFGLAANLAAAISYIVPIFGLLVLLVEEEDNEFLRFNAAQSVAFGFGLIFFRIAMGFTLFLLPNIIAGILGLLLSLFNLVIFVAFIFLAYKAYSEETIELPVVADIARSIEEAL